MAERTWDEQAQWWIDGFAGGADAEYAEQIVPLAAAELAGEPLDGSRRVLDLGCGEGQIARIAALAGVTAIGVDASTAMLDEAARRAGGPRYVAADVAAVPFADAAFDAIVISLVLEHVDDLDGAIAEVARVLASGGRCCIFLNHPVLQAPGSGLVDDHTVDPPERYWRLGPYLVETDADEQVERGVWIRFVHRPLSRYVNTLAEHGLPIERMVELAPPPPHDPAYPRLVYLRARRD